MESDRIRSKRRESGFALVTAVVILVLVSGVVVNLISYSSQELQAGGRLRATLKNLYAADSGVQLSIQRIQLPRDLSAFSYNLTDGTLVESRGRSDAAAMPIEAVGIGAPPDGYSINVGSGFVNELFLLNVTAQAVNRGVVELETKLGSLQPNAGAY
ncbi:MAG: hypothetical protein JRJ58_15455 [Deltaproteobacteria bacterium]|nr:hypothetical protein [Deltaproteobacteria bacterium]